MVRIALVGEFDPTVTAHQAIPRALALAGAAVGIDVEPSWVGTETVGADAAGRLGGFHGVWCVPATPYRDLGGALRAIRHAREAGVPFLGTCGGFQHALIEYARNVCGLTAADHAESNPDAALAVVVPLACALVEVRGRVRLLPGTRAHAAFGTDASEETYHCRYGLHAALADTLFGRVGGLRVSGVDDAGDVRVVELPSHPFFVATLFQPERAALAGRLHPLVAAFVRAAMP